MSDSDVISDQRFPLICVAQVTATAGEGLLYPPLAPGKSGLAGEEIAAIDEGPAVFLGLGDRIHGAGLPPVQ